MAGILKKFETRKFNGWAPNITQKNHLSALGVLGTQAVSNIWIRLQAANYIHSTEQLLSQYPVKEFDTADEYTWKVVGSAKRNIPLVEARNENGETVTADSGNVGAGTQPFELVFGEQCFFKGEFIVGNLNDVYQFRVLDEGRMEGSKVVYRVEMAAGNIDGCPAERLLAGELFSVLAAFIESDLSRRVGGLRFATPSEMRNEWSTIRLYHKVGGEMLDGAKLCCGIPVIKNINGKQQVVVENYWMHHVEWTYEQQFTDYKNNALLWGRSNRNANGEYANVGVSGNVIKTGDGLYAQMEAGNTYYYNKFSLKLLTDALYQLSRGRLTREERHFVLRTGELGGIQFHEAVNELTSGWTAFTTNADGLRVIQKVASPLHDTALAAGYQYVEYLAPNNVRVTLEVDPSYDDPQHGKVIWKDGPAQSYRYDIMNLGTSEEPNIFKCRLKGKAGMSRGWMAGMRNPFKQTNENPYMSYDEDSASYHTMETFGICVLDPTKTMSLIPEVLAA